MTSAEYPDRHVDFVSEVRIAERAHFWRSVHGNPYGWQFDVVEFLFSTYMNCAKSELKLNFFIRKNKNYSPAYVTFNPITLHVDESIWAMAKAGAGYPQFVIAHEIGHLEFHASLPKGFSNDAFSQIRYAEAGNSAEWQANTFAGHFLLPSLVVEQFDHPGQIVELCGTWDVVAESIFSAVNSKRMHFAEQSNLGGACSNCGNFSLYRSGTETICRFCRAAYSS